MKNLIIVVVVMTIIIVTEKLNFIVIMIITKLNFACLYLNFLDNYYFEKNYAFIDMVALHQNL